MDHPGWSSGSGTSMVYQLSEGCDVIAGGLEEQPRGCLRLALSEAADKLAVLLTASLHILHGHLQPHHLQPHHLLQHTHTHTHTQPVLQFGASQEPTCLLWITQNVLAVGFKSGKLRCYDAQGAQICEHAPCAAPIKNMQKRLVPSNGHKPSLSAASLWILYENSILVSMPIYALASDAIGEEVPYHSFKLLQQFTVSDFVIGADTYHQLGGLNPERVLNNVFVGGRQPTLAMYQVGGPQHFQTLGKLATYVKERFTSAVSKAVGGILSNIGVSSRSRGAEVREVIPCTSTLEFEDSTRVVERISVDPYSKLVATTDNLGRVLLFDTRMIAAIRMWKGLRDARLAWHESSSSASAGIYSTLTPTLCLVIYAPWTGLVNVWAMRHGPCLRTVPVGPCAQVLSVFENWEGRILSKCCLLQVDNHALKLEVLDLQQFGEEQTSVRPIESQHSQLTSNGDNGVTEISSFEDSNIDTSTRFLFQDLDTKEHTAEDEALALDAIERVLMTAEYTNRDATPLWPQQLSEETESQIWTEILKVRSSQGLLRLLNAVETSAGNVTLSAFLQRKICKICVDVADTSSSTKLRTKAECRRRLMQAYSTLLDVSSPPPPLALRQVEQSWGMAGNWRQEAIAWGSRVLKAESFETPTAFVSPTRNRSTSSMSTSSSLKFKCVSSVESEGDEFQDAQPGPLIPSGGGSSNADESVTEIKEADSQGFNIDVHNVRVSFDEFCAAFTPPPTPDGAFSLSQPFWSSLFRFYESKLDPPQLNLSSHVPSPVPFEQVSSTFSDLQRSLRMISLLLRPLLCDVFAIQSLSKSITTLKVSVTEVMTLVPPFFWLVPMPMLFASILSRPMTSSPMQRWLRDVIVETLANSEHDPAQPPVQGLPRSNGSPSLSKRLLSPKPVARNPNSTFSLPRQNRPWSPVASGSGAANIEHQVHSPSSASRLRPPPDSQPSGWDLVSSGAHIVTLLRPVLLNLRQWCKLEHAFVIASLIAEVLESVSGQLERKTYGQEDLSLAVRQWTLLLKQIRVCAVLSCREDHPVSISALDNSSPSIFALLAKDTLAFGIDPESSSKHEIRCQEMTSQSSRDKPSKVVLVAWGQAANERWRDIVAMLESEDEANRLPSAGAGVLRRRRPLLMLFPAHNIPHVLGAHRSFLLVERWCNKLHRSVIIVTAAMHLQRVPPMTRAGAALWAWVRCIAPLFRQCWLQALMGSEYVAEEANLSDLSADLKVPNCGTGSRLVQVLLDATAAQDIVQSCLEFLGAILAPSMSLPSSSPPHKSSSSSLSLQMWGVDDPDSVTIWPKDKDSVLQIWLERFLEAPIVLESVRAHEAALRALLVCAQGGLGLGNRPMKTMATRAEIAELFLPHALQKRFAPTSEAEREVVFKARMAFINDSFRGLGERPSNSVYKLAENWDVPVQEVRCMHAVALVEQEQDELAAEVMMKVEDISSVSERMIQIVRERLGWALLLLESSAVTDPAYANLLASLDADVCQWVRAKVVGNSDFDAIARAKRQPPTFTATRNLLLRMAEMLRHTHVHNNSQTNTQVSGRLIMSTSLAQVFG